MDALFISPGDLIPTRLQVMRDLALSLEVSQHALTRNDAEAIARGAAHQAELCRRWNLLETQLRRQPEPLPLTPVEIEREFATLATRIRHLTRVHCSLLRHLQRSLAILGHLAEARALTYIPEMNPKNAQTRPQAGD